MTFPILPSNSPSGFYAIDNSLRFNNDDSPKLNQTVPSTATSTKTMTWNFWIKRCLFGDIQLFCSSRQDGSNLFDFRFHSDDTLIIQDYTSGSTNMILGTNRKFRDSSAWYNVHIIIDTTDATADDRTKIYINGIQETSFASRTNYSLNDDVYRWNTSGILRGIGYETDTNAEYTDGYFSEFNFIDGQALTPTSFGEFDSDSGIWKPIEYTGTYGTNGFYLDFENSGSLGADQSGNGNNFTPTNLASTDQTTDTPTNNFCTLNPLANQLGTALSEGNLQQSDTGNDKNCFSTFGLNTGKWYFEVKAVSVGIRGNILITDADHNEGLGTNYARVQLYDGAVLTSATDNGNLSVFSNGDILCVALDLDNGQVWFSKNANINTGTTALVTNLPLTGTNRDYRVSHFGTSTGTTVQFNFGNPPFSIASGNSDDNGYGNFEYAPPSGYLALCTQNLATELSPTIDDGSAYFQATTYTGDGNDDRQVTNSGNSDLQPDLIWVKNRTQAYNHIVQDTSRGLTTGGYLTTNGTQAESGATTVLVKTATTDGFTVGTSGAVNWSGDNLVAWQWKANAGSTSSNTNGTITSTVQANTTAGFSIVTYTGTGSAGTVGHGLGKTPYWVVVKDRTSSGAWYNQHIGNSSASYGQALNTTGAEQIVSAVFNNTRADSSVFYLGDNINVNTNGNSYVAYIFAPIEGYSKFGKYTGNGSTDGTFIYTGFRPAFVIWKRTDSTQNWFMQDIARNTYNVVGKYLRADTSDTEGDFSTSGVDFISNGFKMRTAGTGFNASGGTYIYMAFAENPFVSSTGISVTAR